MPCAETIRKATKDPYETKACVQKPIASLRTRGERNTFAAKHDGHSFVRWVVMHMKWFREVKKGVYQQKKGGPPVPDDVKYKPKKAETPTQEIKAVFMACVSEHKKIGLWELKKEDWLQCTTSAGKPARGIGWKFLFLYLKAIYMEARRVAPSASGWTAPGPRRQGDPGRADVALWRQRGSAVPEQP